MNTKLIAAVLAIVSAAALTWYISTRSTQPAGNRSVLSSSSTKVNPEQALAKLQADYQILKFDVPFSSQRIANSLRETPVTWSETKAVNDAQLIEPLLLHVEEFIKQRFESTPEEYISWRTRTGYVSKTNEELERSVSLSGVWKGYFDESSVPQLAFDQLFTRALAGQTEQQSGGTKPSALTPDSSAYEIAVGRATREGTGSPRFTGLLATTYMYGSNGSFPSWWKTPRSLKEMLVQQPSVCVAYVGFAVEFLNGDRRAVSVRLIYDDGRKGWYIDSISHASPTSGSPRFPRWEY